MAGTDEEGRYIFDEPAPSEEPPPEEEPEEQEEGLIAKVDRLLLEEAETFKPPGGAAAEAKKALKWKEEHGDAVKGGTLVGWTRANQLAKREDLSYETVKRMYNFFNRHEKNKTIAPEHKYEPWRDNGYVAWLIWGGDAGRSWATKIVKSKEKNESVLTEAAIPRASLKFIENLSKGKKGQLSITALEGALGALGGWTITPTSTFYKLSASSAGDVADWWKKRLSLQGVSIYLDHERGVMINYQRGGRESLSRLGQMVKKAPAKGPTNPELGVLYSDKVGKVESHEWGDHLGWMSLGKSAWIGTEAYKFTAPSGAEFEVPRKLNYSKWDWDGFTSAALWKFMYKEGLKEAAAAYLGGADAGEVDAVLRPSKMRTLENTGTCPVCFGNFKRRKSGKKGMVDHGYTQPKWSFRSGSCPGVSWEPFELSVDGTKNYVDEYIKPVLVERKKQLKALKRGPAKLTVVERRKKTVIKKTDPRYERALRTQIARIESDIRVLDRDLQRFEGLIKNWKAAPLPK